MTALNLRTLIFTLLAVAATPAAGLAQRPNQYASQTSVGQYRAPAKWNRFNVPETARRDFTVGQNLTDFDAPLTAHDGDNLLPEPIPMPPESGLAPIDPPPGGAMTDGMLDGDLSLPASPYDAALEAPCGDCIEPCGPIMRPRLARCFGGASLLLLTLGDDGYRNLVVDDATGAGRMNTDVVDPSATVGFEAFIGRYLCCGRFGVGVGYFLWDPSMEETLLRPGAVGAFAAAFPAFRDIEIDPGPGTSTVFDLYDGAAGYRVRRDLRVQGIEAFWSCFGIMGASRAGRCCDPCPLGRFCVGRKCGGSCDSCCDGCVRPKGYYSVCGPLNRGCGCCLQIINSHGFRWLQIDDDFEFASNTNSIAGYQADDMYYNSDTENNLYGYQFGSRLNYCICCRWAFSIGGKFGLYGNHASNRQRVGTQTVVANRVGAAGDLIQTEDSKTVFSTLGELDLGLQYRVCCAWTMRFGYRMMGVTGIASATDHIASDYTSLRSSGHVDPNDSLFLHGGYVGLDFNW